jgi:hypothetical protein
MTLGGTASRLGTSGNILYMGAGEGDADANVAESYAFIVEITASGQTLTTTPAGVSDTLGGSTTDHNFNTSVIIQPLSAIGQAVGFGEVAQSSSGLVKSAGQLKGTNTNDSAATGYVGELIEQAQNTPQAPAASGSYKAIDSKEFSAGDWEVTVDFYLDMAGMTSVSTVIGAFSTDTASESGTSFPATRMYGSIDTASGVAHGKLGPFRLSLEVADTYYINGKVAYSSSPTQGWQSRIHARRVR